MYMIESFRAWRVLSRDDVNPKLALRVDAKV